MAWILISCLVGALLAGPALAQQSVPAPQSPLSVEFSTKLDKQQDTDGGGGIGVLDPGQVLYVEPPDTSGDSNPRDATDFFPGNESGMEPDSQVDALASGDDAFFDGVVNNTVELLVSMQPDVSGPNGGAVFTETPTGDTAQLWNKAHFNWNNVAGELDELDAIELWGGLGVADAVFYSLNADATGNSVFVAAGAIPTVYLDQGQVHIAVNLLGFNGTTPEVDVDALMVKDENGNSIWDGDDEVIFSIREAANFDGGEIVHWRFGNTPTFLSHGGHDWDTAFLVAPAFGFPGGVDEVDALEASPTGQIVSPASLGVPMFPTALVGLLLMGLLLLIGQRAAARRTTHSS